ncbi:MAG: helix-turn-helix domain-containing protein [Actinomycetota bacterium]|jgi:transposase|nr:helix-turn-helix domain-containing protein [Actinomycetota bacterium]
MKPRALQISVRKRRELLDFLKKTKDKEEYRRAVAVKQKMEGISYRNIAKNISVNYRNVYRMIDAYRKYGLDGIRSKRKNAGKIPKISSEKNKELIKEVVLKSPAAFGYLRNTWSIRLLARHLSKELKMNVSPMHTWRIIRSLGVSYKRPKLALEHDKDYEQKKKRIDNYKKVSAAFLKKSNVGI